MLTEMISFTTFTGWAALTFLSAVWWVVLFLVFGALILALFR